ASRSVQVVDTTAPVLSVPPALNVVTGPGATVCGVVVSNTALGQAAANDQCAGGLVVSRAGVPAGNLFPVGSTTLTYTVSDPSGNTSSGTQTVTVTDNTPPVLVVPPTVHAATGPGAAVCGTQVGDAALGTATATDNCPGAAFVRSGVPAGNMFPVGTTTLTYVASDAAGNTTILTQSVIVVDNTPPTVVCPANIVQQ